MDHDGEPDGGYGYDSVDNGWLLVFYGFWHNRVIACATSKLTLYLLASAGFSFVWLNKRAKTVVIAYPLDTE